MIFDTDVLIWALRGNAKASRAIDAAASRHLSVITYMELLQGARDKHEMKVIATFLMDVHFQMLPLTENIGHRASIYMEAHTLSISMTMPDALIAATAVESNERLVTGNDKHYKAIKELDIVRFRP